MGQKLLAAGSIVSILAVLFSVICLVLPLHHARFYVGGTITLFEMTTYSLNANVWASKKLFNICKGIETITSMKDLCDSDGSTVNLQDVQQAFCTTLMIQALKDGCTGAGFAYGMGIALVVVAVTNAIMQAVGCFLIYQYLQHAMKKQYRETALVLDIIGTILMVFMIIVYYPTAIVHLDSMQPSTQGLASWAIDKSESPMAHGYIMLLLVPVVQGVSIGLLSSGQSSQEVREAERRADEKFQTEMRYLDEVSRNAEESARQQQSGKAASSLQDRIGVHAPPASWSNSLMTSQGSFPVQQVPDISGFGFHPRPSPYVARQSPYAARQSPYAAQGSQQLLQPQAGIAQKGAPYRVQVVPGLQTQMSTGPSRGPYF